MTDIPARSGAEIAEEAVAGVKKATAEGLAILTRTRAQFALAEHPAMGPRMRAWHRGDYRAKPPKPRPEPLDLSLADERNVAAINTMRMLAAATDRPGLRRAAYRDIGGYLRRLRDVRGRDRDRFADIVQRACGMSLRHANRLMAFGENFHAGKSDTWAEIAAKEEDQNQQNEKIP